MTHGPGEDAFFGEHEEHDAEVTEQPRERRRGLGCLPVIVGLVAVLLLGVVAATWGWSRVQDLFADAPDYPGPGSGSVVFEVQEGDTSTVIGRNLKAAGVVKSVDAFNEAARQDEASRGIQVGFYPLKKQMKAADALAVLTKPANMVQDVVTVPEGARVRDIIKTIVAKTDFTRGEVTKALRDPAALGLPDIAQGNPEGYLYPATYTVKPKSTALDLLQQMVSKTVAVEKELQIGSRAKEVGLTPAEALTLASIIEYEANRDEDYPKVSRVFHNRLEKGMKLESDATVSYASGREGDVWTTAEERASQNAYNTYAHVGLPPGPIGSPGEKTIEAALNPADGDWLYFVPDFEKGTTLFTADYNEHLRNAERAKEYCRQSEEC